MKITFIQTGGTIDKKYPQTMASYSFEIDDPAFVRILAEANPSFESEFVECLRKDSLDMTDEDRNLLAKLCAKIKNDKIIITHGTDTMVKSAEVINKVLVENKLSKIVVLTGAMRPEAFKDSDAGFNLGMAVGAVNALVNSEKSGVYIAMSGRVYPFDKCIKNPNGVKFTEK